MTKKVKDKESVDTKVEKEENTSTPPIDASAQNLKVPEPIKPAIINDKIEEQVRIEFDGETISNIYFIKNDSQERIDFTPGVEIWKSVLPMIKIPITIKLFRDIVIKRCEIYSEKEQNEILNIFTDSLIKRFHNICSAIDFYRISKHFFAANIDNGFKSDSLIKFKKIVCDDKKFANDLISLTRNAEQTFDSITTDQFKSQAFRAEFSE